VTSTDSGLAVPDWPLSYGTFFPPMVGGIFYEHGHRMAASFVGLLTLILAIWLGIKEKRVWVRYLGYCALGAVVLQGILGGSVSLSYVNKFLEAELKERGLYSDELINRIVEEGTLQNIPEIPEDMKRVYVTAMDIAAEDHIRMQAAFQKHVDNSITKTCNFPNDYPEAFFKQLTVEYKAEKVNKITGAREGFTWYRPASADNHSWDLMVYTWAALDMLVLAVCEQHFGLEYIDYNVFWQAVEENKLYFES